MQATEFDKVAIEAAARRLVGGFSRISQDWAKLVAEHIDEDEFVAFPMWGTLFKVDDGCDRSNIEKLLLPIGPLACETVAELLQFATDHGLNASISALAALASAADDETDEDELDNMKSDLLIEWQELGYEIADIAASGWQAVGDTGVMAREFDGELLLGIDGAGYDFHEDHWIPLYLALGYGWHERIG